MYQPLGLKSKSKLYYRRFFIDSSRPKDFPFLRKDYESPGKLIIGYQTHSYGQTELGATQNLPPENNRYGNQKSPEGFLKPDFENDSYLKTPPVEHSPPKATLGEKPQEANNHTYCEGVILKKKHSSDQKTEHHDEKSNP